MAKYKAAKKKQDLPPQVRPGAPCLVLIVVAFILLMLAMYFAMKNAG
ncbi:MAG TPA: hypothetical protein VHC90_22360 [Bryobacteraceae bacterium]|nr:hypothetical protein [Bryobacteraceae bacterium]